MASPNVSAGPGAFSCDKAVTRQEVLHDTSTKFAFENCCF